MVYGFLNVFKPKGITSFDVIRKLRKNPGIKKMGHLGTLDPIAEGVLVIAVNQATKVIEFLMGLDKEYICTLKLGAKSNTYDAEGKIEKVSDKVPELNEIDTAIKEFIGETDQAPPVFSALKVKGKAAYEYARKGEKIELSPRKVKISNIDKIQYDYPEVEFTVNCSSGTYIRSLVHDIGEKLGTGAYMTELIRTKVGDFDIKDSFKIDEITKNTLKDQFIKCEDMLKFENLDLEEKEFEKLSHGQTIEFPDLVKYEKKSSTLFLGFYNGDFKGILEKKGNNLIKFKKQL